MTLKIILLICGLIGLCMQIIANRKNWRRTSIAGFCISVVGFALLSVVSFFSLEMMK